MFANSSSQNQSRHLAKEIAVLLYSRANSSRIFYTQWSCCISSIYFCCVISTTDILSFIYSLIGFNCHRRNNSKTYSHEKNTFHYYLLLEEKPWEPFLSNIILIIIKKWNKMNFLERVLSNYVLAWSQMFNYKDKTSRIPFWHFFLLDGLIGGLISVLSNNG